MAAIIILSLIGLAALIFPLPRAFTSIAAWRRIVPPERADQGRVAIVFGAGLWRDGSPTPVLEDRVKTAAELYFAGKVEKLLMSGTSTPYYNETKAMRNYAMSLGIPNPVIVQDYGGLRTYDTCYRAKHVYGIDQAILVTQGFHLPRALFLCNAIGIKAQGVAADLREYRQRSQLWWNLRELPATLMAFWEVYVQPPKLDIGEPQPIFTEKAQ